MRKEEDERKGSLGKYKDFGYFGTTHLFTPSSSSVSHTVQKEAPNFP